MANPNPKRSNLKPFKKGKDERRNMNGAPKLPDLDSAMADVLGGDSGGLSKVLGALYAKALKGDTRAAEILLSRGYGLPKQTIQSNVVINDVSKTGFSITTKAD